MSKLQVLTLVLEIEHEDKNDDDPMSENKIFVRST